MHATSLNLQRLIHATLGFRLESFKRNTPNLAANFLALIENFPAFAKLPSRRKNSSLYRKHISTVILFLDLFRFFAILASMRTKALELLRLWFSRCQTSLTGPGGRMR